MKDIQTTIRGKDHSRDSINDLISQGVKNKNTEQQCTSKIYFTQY